VDELFHARYPGIQALLFGDQLAAQRRADIVEYALGLGMFFFSLSKNTSHITQTLDEAPFGTMQAEKARRNEEALMDGVLTNTNTRDALQLAAYAAERRAFTGSIIHGAVRAGLTAFRPGADEGERPSQPRPRPHWRDVRRGCPSRCIGGHHGGSTACQ